jgi:hypothetical protein
MTGFSDNSGFGVSVSKVATIADGQTTISEPLDLGRIYAWIVVRCADVSNAAATTDTLSFQLGVTVDDTLAPLRVDSASKTILLDAVFHEVLFVGAARRVKPILSDAADGGTVIIEVYGIDAAVVG